MVQSKGCQSKLEAIEKGVKPVVLKNWLGHTNIHVTLDTYADVFESLKLRQKNYCKVKDKLNLI